jgi:hypothetical protein
MCRRTHPVSVSFGDLMIAGEALPMRHFRAYNPYVHNS